MKTVRCVPLFAMVVALGSGVGAGQSPAAGAAAAAPPWSGRLSIAAGQRGFVDERRAPQLPVLAHFGEAFSAFVHAKTVDGTSVEAQLQSIKAAGFDGIRFWDTLGYFDEAWRGKEVMPWAFTNKSGQRIGATPEYYAKLRDFLALVRRLGLTTHHSRGDLNSRAVAEVVQHAERVASIYDEIGWQVNALFEGNNEDFQNGSFGPDGLRRIVEPAKRRGALTASSCPGACSDTETDLRAYTRGFSVFYVHGSREGTATERMKRIFTLGYEAAASTDARLGWQGEPIGPNDRAGIGVTIGHTEDVEELGLLAVTSLVARQAWVYMSQCGVFWRCRIDSHPGFAAVPRMRAALHGFAPDVMAWRLSHGGRGDAAWCVPDGCRGGLYFGDPGVTSGPARINQAISPDGRRAVAIVDGGRGAKRVRNFMKCTARVTVISPSDDETLQTQTLTVASGADLALEYRVGRLLLAACE